MNMRFAVPGVDARTPLSAAAPALLIAKAAPLFALEGAARSGEEADAVHDMRVASRRLREAMRLLGPLYGPAMKSWYKRVRKITRALGPVRDSDVFIDEFSHLLPDLAEEGKRAVAFMVGWRTGRREAELTALNSVLSGLELAQGRASFEKAANALHPGSAGSEPLATFAHASVAERAAVVFGLQPQALVESQILKQHELRIAYKRLRYAVEVFAPCYGDDFDAVHDALTAFQDTLGEMHDTHVFQEMLQDPSITGAARRGGVTEEGLAELGRLLERRGSAGFAKFESLVRKHPAESLIGELLLPLTRSAPVVDAPEALADELPVVSPVRVGDEPWAEEWESEPLADATTPPDGSR